MAGQHYCLRWNNYQSNMTSVFHQLLQTEAFVDVTLACNEASLKAHKVVLSACSSYFQKLLLSNPCKHPTIIMPQDVCFNDLKFIIEFVYRGEIDVSQAELQQRPFDASKFKLALLSLRSHVGNTTPKLTDTGYTTPYHNSQAVLLYHRRPLNPAVGKAEPVGF
ncbi:hypothetical protein TSAR_008768 [Trichomalopsis sarcophagae]|uniref:BTB domain-containing protein n=1 Tax=Trichomalopsis sarcophagae TaxID=543379 RepID=A0A232EZA3_9HYME|nr:hypothetical protein TSAR_008768 [Trichomalopsis sarcophagae]